MTFNSLQLFFCWVVTIRVSILAFRPVQTKRGNSYSTSIATTTTSDARSRWTKIVRPARISHRDNVGSGLCRRRTQSSMLHVTLPPADDYNNNDIRNTEDDFESLVQAATSNSNGYALGGDFAGLVATFNPGDGSFIPIPDHLIPPSMIEWGQIPKCLEVLVSEEFWPTTASSSGEVSNVDDDGEEILRRITTNILPDTGCSVDNLETIKAIDEIDLSSRWDSNEDPSIDGSTNNVVGLQYSVGDDEIRLETIFELEGGGGYRMRVAIDLMIPSLDTIAIQSPTVLTLERRTSSVSSGGTISDGGGLDGRTVSMLLGERLQSSKTFVDDQPMGQTRYEVDAINYVNLPGGISIAYGWLTEDDWMLQVGMLMQNGMRRVVSRQFTVFDNGELDFDVKSWMEEPETDVPVL
jgi:hypothetical protein